MSYLSNKEHCARFCKLEDIEICFIPKLPFKKVRVGGQFEIRNKDFARHKIISCVVYLKVKIKNGYSDISCAMYSIFFGYC